MDQHSKRREDYRRNHSTLNLTRNQAFATNDEPVKVRNLGKRIIAIVATLLICLGVSYGAHMYFTIHSAISAMNGGNTATSPKIANRQPISVLILGVDQGIEGRHDQGNSDTIILATANPAKKSATMTSIPRDTLVNVKGDPGNKYFMFRVNSAYEVGGVKASMKTVSSLLNVPINYYLTVNMKALSSLVNAVGGVSVKVPFSFSYDWADFHKGTQHLDGRHAVAYVRMRKEDPRGDYGRQLRQRQVIEAVAKKAMSVNTLTNYRKLVNIFGKYVKTNLSLNDMLALAMTYRSTMSGLKSTYIQGHDAWINGSSIQVASTKELQKKSNMIRKNLNLPVEVLDNDETRQNTLNEQENHINWKDLNAFENYQIYDQDRLSQVSGSSSSTSANSQSSSDKQKNWFSKLFK